MHNSQLLVSQGQQVAEGVQVSLSGSTGLSTGPHVHWDINSEGVEVNSFSRFIDPVSLLLRLHHHLHHSLYHLRQTNGCWKV